MGASGSRAAHHVEVRLEPPVNEDPGEGLLFVARVHSAADGVCNYRVWGEPQMLGLWADDIVTISLYAAQTEDHFNSFHYHEVAELYVPWEVVWRESRPGEEVFFNLAISRTAPWLGSNASLKEYREAFRRARDAAHADPVAPHLRVGVREVLAANDMSVDSPWEAGNGTPSPLPGLYLDSDAARGGPRGTEQERQGWRPPSFDDWPEMPMPTPKVFEDCAQDGDYRVYQLQLRNQELRRQCTALGLRDVDVPDVEDQVRASCDLYVRSSAENAQLRHETQALERELANAYGEVELLGAPQGGQEDAARHIMQEIRGIIQQNIDLSGQSDGHLRQLEEDISAVSSFKYQKQLYEEDGDNEVELLRQQLEQQQEGHQAILEECRRLEDFLEAAAGEARAQRSEAEGRRCDELDGRCRHLREEIEDLQQQLRDRPSLPGSGEDGTMTVPATCVLSDEVDHLQAQLAEQQRRRAQEQVEMEQRPGQLRRETRALQDRLQETLEAREKADQELEALQQSHERELEELRTTAVERAAATRAREEKELLRESLSKDIGRSRRRIEFFDQKVQQLLAESKDLRQRAELAWQSVPAAPDHAGAEVGALQEQLGGWQQQLQESRREREVLQRERDQARQDLENSLVEARVAEQKLRLLRDRTAPKPPEIFS